MRVTALAALCAAAFAAPAAAPTVVVPHRGVAFDPAKENAVWCATFEMAWQAFGRDVLKEPLRLGPPAPAAFVEGMNVRPYPLDAVDADSCIAVAGRKGDGILERIAKEGKEKFGLDLPKMKVTLERPDDLLAYAFLRKDLPFEHPFRPIRGGMSFAGATGSVPGWGINPGEIAATEKARGQVRLLSRSPSSEPDAFVLEFTPKGGGDRLLLALVPGSPDLAAAWKGVEERVKAGKPRALKEDAILRVPRIRMDLQRRFEEILGAPLANEGFKGYRVAQAEQSILFRLDETGAVLESEAVVGAKLEETRERPDVFNFDRPFLVALVRKDAKEPYFLAWIANGELLAK